MCVSVCGCVCVHTCFVHVIFEAFFQARHQVWDATSVSFHGEEFALQLVILCLLCVRLQGLEAMLFFFCEGADKWILDGCSGGNSATNVKWSFVVVVVLFFFNSLVTFALLV